MYLFKNLFFLFKLQFIYANMCCYDNFQWLGNKYEKNKNDFHFKIGLQKNSFFSMYRVFQ